MLAWHGCMHLRKTALQSRCSPDAGKRRKRRAELTPGQQESDMYSMDDFLRLNGGDTLSRTMDRNRQRAGIRRNARNTDINAFLASCGFKGRRK
jgi:hypothetical protein